MLSCPIHQLRNASLAWRGFRRNGENDCFHPEPGQGHSQDNLSPNEMYFFPMHSILQTICPLNEMIIPGIFTLGDNWFCTPVLL